MRDTPLRSTASSTEDRAIGGQAVIEGVMIRSPDRIATAVRRPDGHVVVHTDPYVGLANRVRGLGLPVLRGVVSFAEMLVIGVQTLNFSASLATVGPQPTSGWRDRLLTGLSTAVALIAGVGIFMFLPLAACNALGLERNAVAYNVLAGAVRVALLLGYVWAIGRVADIRRVFAYHGAEHQVIFAYEADEELTVQAAKKYSRLHPRCGTSFILIVVLLAIVAYAAVDSGFAWLVGRPATLAERFVVHMTFLPLISGVSYEALKASGRHRNAALVRVLTAPGLWLQRLTTRPPDDEQLAVAVAAARSALGLSVSATPYAEPPHAVA